MSERDITITKLQRCEQGWWTARVTVNGHPTVSVDRRYGSWMAEVRTAPRVQQWARKDVGPEIAARLQEKVRPIERRERLEVQEGISREQHRRMMAFRELKPSAKDLAARKDEVEDELAGELRGVTLERIYTEPAFAWARPIGWAA